MHLSSKYKNIFICTSLSLRTGYRYHFCVYMLVWQTRHTRLSKRSGCGPYCEDALVIVSIGRLFPLYIHTNYLILNPSTITSMLIPLHIFENLCRVSLEPYLWAFSMLSELIPKVSNSYVFQRYLSNATLTHSKQTYLFSIWVVGCCLCHFVHSLKYTQKATVTSWYEPSLKVYFRSQFLQVFTTFGCNYIFQFRALTMEHQIPSQAKFKFR